MNNLLPDNLNPTEITSSIHNFTYIQSPITIEQDLKALLEISHAKKVAIIVNPVFKTLDYDITNDTSQFHNVDFQLIIPDSGPLTTLGSINDDIDAVYVLSPLAGYTSYQAELLVHGISDKGIPSFVFDNQLLEYGAYAAFSLQESLQKISRRVALYATKIAEGKDPKDFPVQMEAFPRQFVFNMEVVNKIGIYPNWNVLDNASLVHVNKLDTERKLTLKSAIAEGLENNLEYHITKKQTESAQQDVALAKSNYLPSINAKSTGLFLIHCKCSTFK